MRTVCLQDWTTISGSAAVVQNASDWLDVAEFADATFWLDVRQVTNPGAGTLALAYETSPTRDDSLFQPMTSLAALSPNTSGPTIRRVFLNGGPLVPLSRFVRWKLTPSVASSFSVTFRAFASFGYGTPGAICPLGIPGCALWLRADRGVTLNSGRVSGWADQSGNARNFSQGTAGNQPLFVASDVNGQPVVSFDNSRPDWLVGPSFAATSAGLTLGVVVDYQASANFGMFLAQDSLDELRNFLTSGRPDFATQGLDNCQGALAASNTWVCLIGRHDGVSNAIELRRNKSSIASATGGNVGTATLAVGARTAGSFPMLGKLAEVVLWNRNLTQAEADLYASYAVAQWNLSLP